MKTDELYSLWAKDKDNVLEITAEECSELVQAVTKIMRYGVNDERKMHLAEEISDVRICIEGVCEAYGFGKNCLAKIHGMERKPEAYTLAVCGDITRLIGMLLYRSGQPHTSTDLRALRGMFSALEHAVSLLIDKHGIQDGDLTRWRTMKLERMEQRLTHGIW